MSLGDPHPEQPPTPAGSDEPGPGRLRPIGPGVVVGWLSVGLVAGWLVRPVTLELEAAAPRVTWLQCLALYLVAGVIALVARATHQALQQRQGGLRPHQAVNRLVLAKSCAVAGALVAGAYLGYALSWVGIGSELAGERIAMSLVAAVGALLTLGASLLLERACRVRDDEESL